MSTAKAKFLEEPRQKHQRADNPNTKLRQGHKQVRKRREDTESQKCGTVNVSQRSMIAKPTERKNTGIVDN